VRRSETREGRGRLRGTSGAKKAVRRRDWQSVWREKAQELVPEEYRSAAAYGENQNPMRVFFEVLPAVREAHRAGDDAKLKAIYAFAAWCYAQPEKDISNAAGVAFYEHLFDSRDKDIWPLVMPYIGPSQWQMVLALHEVQLNDEDLKGLLQLRAQHVSGSDW